MFDATCLRNRFIARHESDGLLLQVASEGRHEVRFAVAVVQVQPSTIVRVASSSTHPTTTRTQGARGSQESEPERTRDRRVFLEDPRRRIRPREDVSRLSSPPAVAHRTRSDATAIAPDVGDARFFPSSDFPLTPPLPLTPSRSLSSSCMREDDDSR